jgi:uncharacterized protein (DUF2062 family)
MITLPRQARDKHRESTQKETRSHRRARNHVSKRNLIRTATATASVIAAGVVAAG